MRFTGPRSMALPLLLAACTSSVRPNRLTGPGVSPAVWGVLEEPHTPGPHPAVILLPGSYGWRPDYALFARTFADSGFVTLAIDYYAETGRGASHAEEARNWPAWQATVRNAVDYLDTLPSVSSRHIGLVGYSRGAFLAVSVAGSVPSVRAVVDFYGGGSDGDPADEDVPRFPPLLILHGEADTEVSVDLAHRLYDRMQAHGGEVEMHLYPGAQHVFNGPWAPTYSAPDDADAWRRTIEFLRRRLAR
ncbi:MAG: dienelactone hydrolase family protein [Gemmatimonadota bacterium]